MALVQRKVGRLPARRHKLYEEAVGVLLNWRGDVDAPLDAEEALPQLEYVAWAMCDRGVQRLRRDEVLSLLEDVRSEYPNIRLMRRRTPEEFLKLVDSRTSLLVEVGTVRHDGLETAVYEFRHLTFQEYLAAVALIRGHFPGHDPGKSLAERVAPLAGNLVEVETDAWDGRGLAIKELQVTEHWREALRLCVAACNDDDVDATLRAILGETISRHALASGSHDVTSDTAPINDGTEPGASARRLMDADETRPRAILAALCLADEPNASQSVADEVFARFTAATGKHDGLGRDASTGLDRAAKEVATSVWAEPLSLVLAAEFLRRGPEDRGSFGGLSGMVTVRSSGLLPVNKAETGTSQTPASQTSWMQTQLNRLRDPDNATAVAAALAVMIAAFEEGAVFILGLSEALLALTARGPAASHAACWALYWLCDGRHERKPVWRPNADELDHLAGLLPGDSPSSLTDTETLYWLAAIAVSTRSPTCVPGLLTLLDHEYERLRNVAINALGEIGDPRAVEPLTTLLNHQFIDTRRATLGALVATRRDGLDDLNVKLLTQYDDGADPWLDPREPIDDDRVQEASDRLELPPDEVRRRYEALAADFHLTLSWQQS